MCLADFSDMPSNADESITCWKKQGKHDSWVSIGSDTSRTENIFPAWTVLHGSNPLAFASCKYYVWPMEHANRQTEDTKVVILHGFTKEQIFAVMRSVKRELGPEADVAFAMTTAHSLEMKMGDVIGDIAGDHAYLKKNPPVRTTPSPQE